MIAPAVAFVELVLAVHILAVVIAFGVTFAYPLLFATASRMDPSVMPWLFRTMQRIGRMLINPGLLVLVLAGIYLASDEHQWHAFYVQWGIGAALVIGAIEGAFMIPREGRIANLAERDLTAAGVTTGGGTAAVAQRGGSAVKWSVEYDSLFKQLAIGGGVLDLTVFVMAAHAADATIVGS